MLSQVLEQNGENNFGEYGERVNYVHSKILKHRSGNVVCALFLCCVLHIAVPLLL